jgi:hypothetical protein
MRKIRWLEMQRALVHNVAATASEAKKRHKFNAILRSPYSHSIVPGGLEV